MKDKCLVSSITKDDLKWEFYAGSTKGGQAANRNKCCCRVRHEPSGAEGNAKDTRYQSQNKLLAFRRLAESEKFQKWARGEAARKKGNLSPEEAAHFSTENLMNRPEDFKLEVKDASGNWVVVDLDTFLAIT